jgi:hypothetical protein
MRWVRTAMGLGIMLAAVSLGVAGCAGIKLTDDGQNVLVMKPLEVLDNCENLGNIRVNAKNINREREDKDRATLARNMAATMGGNVVVAASEVVDNSQEWTAYRCP